MKIFRWAYGILAAMWLVFVIVAIFSDNHQLIPIYVALFAIFNHMAGFDGLHYKDKEE